MQSSDARSFVSPVILAVPPAYRGAAAMILCAVSFAFMAVFIKLSYNSGASVGQVVFFRNLFAFALCLPWFLQVGWEGQRTQILGWHLLRAVVGFSAMMLYFSSFLFKPMSEVISLNFSAPLFTLVGGALILHERVGPRRVGAALIGFAGVLLIVRPWSQSIGWTELMPLIAAVVMGMVPLILRRMSRTESTSVMVWYQSLIMTLFSLPLVLMMWQEIGWTSWLFMLGCGVVGYVGQMFLAESLHHGEASEIMIYDYCRLPIVAVIELALFGVLPSIWVVPGVLLIAASAVYIARREAFLKREQGQA